MGTSNAWIMGPQIPAPRVHAPNGAIFREVIKPPYFLFSILYRKKMIISFPSSFRRSEISRSCKLLPVRTYTTTAVLLLHWTAPISLGEPRHDRARTSLHPNNATWALAGCRCNAICLEAPLDSLTAAKVLHTEPFECRSPAIPPVVELLGKDGNNQK